jgi:hypothetical protein
MKFPQTKSFLNSMATRLLAVLVVITAMALAAFAQATSRSLAPIPESVGLNIEQCANGPVTAPILCNVASANDGYTRGNLVASKSHYLEGDSVPIRILLEGITTGTSYTITVGYDYTKGGLYATDYLTSFDRTEMRPGNNPCVGVTACGAEQLFPITPDPQVAAGYDGISMTADDITQIGGSISCFGCTITAISVPTFVSDTSGDSSKFVTITFTAQQSNVVIAYGSHISTRQDWGVGHSAIFISGSPYHNFVSATSIPDTNNGNRDLQLSAEAVIAPATVKIVKLVNTLDPLPVGCTAGDPCDPRFRSTFVFGFTNPDLRFDGDGSFTLVDSDPAQLGGGFVSKGGITAFGAANTITVTESQVIGGRFTLTSLVCSGGGANTTTSGPTATIVLDEGEDVVCTFTNGENVVTAAPASISGRVLDSNNKGIARAYVTVLDAATGEMRFTRTNLRGWYTFEGLDTASFYAVSVNAKGYTFSSPTQFYTLNDNLADVDFIANPF